MKITKQCNRGRSIRGRNLLLITQPTNQGFPATERTRVHFLLQVKNGNVISTRQNMKYQSYANLQFKNFRKISQHKNSTEVTHLKNKKNKTLEEMVADIDPKYFRGYARVEPTGFGA